MHKHTFHPVFTDVFELFFIVPSSLMDAQADLS